MVRNTRYRYMYASWSTFIWNFVYVQYLHFWVFNEEVCFIYKFVLKWFILDLLEAIHKLGQSSENLFSQVKKLSDKSKVQSSHPVYGLKRDLLRVIGNFCYKHRANQDKVNIILFKSDIYCWHWANMTKKWLIHTKK